MANKYWKQFMLTPHVSPCILDFNFVVDPANGNGLGIRSLKGNGIANVYMHTSATPAATNPNPAAGEIIIQLADNYNKFLGAWGGFVSPLNGSSSTSSTANVINVVVSVGTATLAQWQAVGWPLGLPIPTVGAAFVATSSAVIGGSAAVQLRATAGAGIDHIEVVGDANQTLINTAIQNPALPQASGGYIYMACFLDAVLTAPATNSVIGLQFYLSNHNAGSASFQG